MHCGMILYYNANSFNIDSNHTVSTSIFLVSSHLSGAGSPMSFLKSEQDKIGFFKDKVGYSKMIFLLPLLTTQRFHIA